MRGVCWPIAHSVASERETIGYVEEVRIVVNGAPARVASGYTPSMDLENLPPGRGD
jgi:hypothetical protein